MFPIFCHEAKACKCRNLACLAVCWVHRRGYVQRSTVHCTELVAIEGAGNVLGIVDHAAPVEAALAVEALAAAHVKAGQRAVALLEVFYVAADVLNDTHELHT